MGGEEHSGMLPEATLDSLAEQQEGIKDGPQGGEGEGEQIADQVNSVCVWLLFMLEQNPLLTSDHTPGHRRNAPAQSRPVFLHRRRGGPLSGQA